MSVGVTSRNKYNMRKRKSVYWPNNLDFAAKHCKVKSHRPAHIQIVKTCTRKSLKNKYFKKINKKKYASCLMKILNHINVAGYTTSVCISSKQVNLILIHSSLWRAQQKMDWS